MVFVESRFSEQKVTWVNNFYPNDSREKMKMIKKESELFREKIKKDLCDIKELNEEKNFQMK